MKFIQPNEGQDAEPKKRSENDTTLDFRYCMDLSVSLVSPISLCIAIVVASVYFLEFYSQNNGVYL